MDHSDLFENDNYWDVLYSAIALNVDCTINKLDQPDLFGDTETFDSKNKTDKGFIEFLYQYKSPLSTKREMYLSDPNNYQISPFDSQKKRMTTYVKNDNFPQGSFEALLAHQQAGLFSEIGGQLYHCGAKVRIIERKTKETHYFFSYLCNQMVI